MRGGTRNHIATKTGSRRHREDAAELEAHPSGERVADDADCDRFDARAARCAGRASAPIATTAKPSARRPVEWRRASGRECARAA